MMNRETHVVAARKAMIPFLMHWWISNAAIPKRQYDNKREAFVGGTVSTELRWSSRCVVWVVDIIDASERSEITYTLCYVAYVCGAVVYACAYVLYLYT